MVLVNHFLDTNISGILIPNRAAANVTNSAASITAQANICVGLYGSKPNFILVGYFGCNAYLSLRVCPTLWLNFWLTSCMNVCMYSSTG